MASRLYNLARMTTATTGTGTITLGAAVSGYLTFAQAGISNGDVVDYAIKDGSSSEIGTGTYTSSGTTLTRTVTKSTNSNAAINLSGAAEVFITPRAETLADASLLTAGTLDPARIGTQALNQSKLLLGGSTQPGPSDLNNNLTSGFYAATGYSNTPEGAGSTGNYWYVIVQAWDVASYAQQIAMPLTSALYTNEMFIRTLIAGSWTGWERLQKPVDNTRVLLGTLTANNTANFLAHATIFQSGFRSYEIQMENLLPATNTAHIGLRYYVGGANVTTGYVATAWANAGAGTGQGQSTTWVPICNTSTNAIANSLGGLSGKITIWNPAGSQAKHCEASWVHPNSSSLSQFMSGFSSGLLNTGSPLDGFNLSCDNGNIASGSAYIYGLR